MYSFLPERNGAVTQTNRRFCAAHRKSAPKARELGASRAGLQWKPQTSDNLPVSTWPRLRSGLYFAGTNEWRHPLRGKRLPSCTKLQIQTIKGSSAYDRPCSAKGNFGFFTSPNATTAAPDCVQHKAKRETVCEYVFDWLQRGHPFSSFPPLNAIKKIAHTPAARARSTTKVCILNTSLIRHGFTTRHSIGLHRHGKPRGGHSSFIE